MKHGCRIRQEPKQLLDKSVESLILAIELLNRPSDVARVHASLIMLHHSFEMLMKATVLHRRGRIFEAGHANSISFEACLRKGMSDGKLQFLNETQATILRAIGGYRDASYHYLLGLSEEHLYAIAELGVDTFCDLMKAVFNTDPSAFLPERVLPISSIPPTSIDAIFARETKRVRELLAPRKKTHLEAKAILRSMAILEGAVQGEARQPSANEIDKLAGAVKSGADWESLFSGVARATVAGDGDQITLALKLESAEGLPVRWWKPGEPEEESVPIKKVANESFYSLGKKDLAAKLGISEPRCFVLRRYFSIDGNPDYHWVFRFGRTRHDRYSPRALAVMKEGIASLSLEEIESIWQTYRPRKLAR